MLSGDWLIPPWLVLAGFILVAVGLWAILWMAQRGVVWLWDWVRHDRVTPLLEDDEAGCVCCEEGCHYGVDPDECGQCGHPEAWHAEDLPPEQSSEALGFTGPLDRGWALAVDAHDLLMEHAERRMPLWDSENRAAYAAVGLDYPSGLLARVRELAP